MMNAGSATPSLPPMDGDGNYPALAAAEATISRTIIRRRGAVGLTQKPFADTAGKSVKVLNRAERATAVPSLKILTKLEAALQAAGGNRCGRSNVDNACSPLHFNDELCPALAAFVNAM